jgi:hypothetical protein
MIFFFNVQQWSPLHAKNINPPQPSRSGGQVAFGEIRSPPESQATRERRTRFKEKAKIQSTD